jgi:hypothetical protein
MTGQWAWKREVPDDPVRIFVHGASEWAAGDVGKAIPASPASPAFGRTSATRAVVAVFCDSIIVSLSNASNTETGSVKHVFHLLHISTSQPLEVFGREMPGPNNRVGRNGCGVGKQPSSTSTSIAPKPLTLTAPTSTHNGTHNGTHNAPLLRTGAPAGPPLASTRNANGILARHAPRLNT